MRAQLTLKKTCTFQGIGLHTGKFIEVSIKPSRANKGIVFIRTDIADRIEIPAHSSFVTDTKLSTTLSNKGVSVATVEHILAALWGLGIDNAVIEINGPEVPILDGSSYHFVRQIKKDGIVKLAYLKKWFVITKPLSVVEGDRYCYLLSYKYPKMTCSIDFDHPLLKNQKIETKLDSKAFVTKLAKARTFCLLKEVEKMRNMGLIKGGSLESAVVLDDQGVVNPEGMRFQNECVRHKALDAIGDMALTGFFIIGHLVTHKAGHELHYRLIRKLMTERCGYLLGSEEVKEATVESFINAAQATTA